MHWTRWFIYVRTSSQKNYIVYGLLRKSATDNTKNIKSLIENRDYFNKRFFLRRVDMLDVHSIESAI